MIGEQDGPQLGQLLEGILERGEYERPLVERLREQLHAGLFGREGGARFRPVDSLPPVLAYLDASSWPCFYYWFQLRIASSRRVSPGARVEIREHRR